MLRFNAHRFIKIIASSAEFYGMLKIMMPNINVTAMETTFLPEVFVKEMPKVLGDMKIECEESLLLSASDHIEDMLLRIRLPNSGAVTLADYFRFDAELNKRIEHELKRKKFYQLKPDVAGLFEAAEPFGTSVALRFGSAIYDIGEASKCFACERYTASVFHLMRTLECALKQFAGMLGIDYQINWDAYIKAVTKLIQNTDAKNPEDRAKRDFVSKAATLLQGIGHAWRNPSMHVGSEYGLDQAGNIFNSTKAFMQGFADGLDDLEKKNVRWQRIR
jgi:hypothetical protein